MAKKQTPKLQYRHPLNKKIFILVAVSVATVGALVLRVSNASTANTGLDRLNIMKTVNAEIGTREGTARQHEYTGRSDNPEWCAYFVSWAMKASGYPLRDGSNFRVPSVFYNKQEGNLRDIFIANGSYIEYKGKQTGRWPVVGDILIFGRSHTGFVSQTNEGGRLYTIEGNSAAAGKPNSVARNSYDSLDAAGIIGWGNVDNFILRSPTKK